MPNIDNVSILLHLYFKRHKMVDCLFEDALSRIENVTQTLFVSFPNRALFLEDFMIFYNKVSTGID
jgi:hypothetical protein